MVEIAVVVNVTPAGVNVAKARAGVFIPANEAEVFSLWKKAFRSVKEVSGVPVRNADGARVFRLVDRNYQVQYRAIRPLN